MAINTKNSTRHLFESDDYTIQKVLDKTFLIAGLNEKLQAILNPPLSQYCRIANVQNGRIMLQVDSPVWANQLRFMLTDVLSELRRQPGLEGLVGIDFFVRPPLHRATRPTLPKPKLSQSSADLLKYTADSIKDPAIKAMLEQIATRAKPQ